MEPCDQGGVLWIYAGGANIPEIRVQRSIRWWNCEERCKVEHRELAGGNHSMAVVPLGVFRVQFPDA